MVARHANNDAVSQTAVGLGVGVALIAVDGWLSGFEAVRAISTAFLTALSFWILAPVAYLAADRPVHYSILALFVGAGAGALWWGIVTVDYWIWTPIGIGAAVGLFALTRGNSKDAVVVPLDSGDSIDRGG